MRRNFKGYYVARCTIPQGWRAEYLRELRIVFAANMEEAREVLRETNKHRRQYGGYEPFEWSAETTAAAMLRARRYVSEVVCARAWEAEEAARAAAQIKQEAA